MAVFRCKMCGGTLEFENETTAYCAYCGTKQTLPRLSDERRAAMYDKANTLRQHNEFDRAMGIFEQIVTEDPTDAESYWSLVLCTFGIDYVEDPATKKRIPTVNRAQKTSIFDDINYKLALEHADIYQKSIYEDEAAAINEIQKGILSISDKEEPFDVFICYKDTDENGERTHDSLLAEDIYNKLTKEGLKVFFSRITLEDKLGTAYEPYIFAALNSSKVMIVVGTKKEYLEAVWVKNEWSRYLALIRDGADKILIPAYRDMNPYDLPDEFAHLQAQDMGKIAFMHDLTRAVKKITAVPEKKEVPKEQRSHTDILIKRAFMALEDREFSKAEEFAEQSLDEEPENASAYLCKLLAELKVTNEDELINLSHPFDNNGSYKKLIRFADNDLKIKLESILDEIEHRNEEQRKLNEYNRGLSRMNEAKSDSQFNSAAEIFSKLPGYKDSDTLAENCRKMAEQARIQNIYNTAYKKMNNNTRSDVEEAIRLFESIIDYEDSRKHIGTCNNQLKEIKKLEKKAAKNGYYASGSVPVKKKKGHGFLIFIILVLIGVGAYFVFTNVIPSQQSSQVAGLLQNNDYSEAFLVIMDIEDIDKRNAQLSSFWDEAAIRSKISAGGTHTLAISEGVVLSAGSNGAGQCNTSDFSDIIDISAGLQHTVVLDSNGKVSATGSNASGQCNVEEWADFTIVDVSAGFQFTAALKNDGTVVAIGNNERDQLNTEEWTNIRSISAGGVHLVGLKMDGTVVAIGDNAYGQCDVEEWENIVAVSAGRFCTIALKADGTCIAIGEFKDEYGNEIHDPDVSDWTDIVAVAAGDYHAVGLKSDGTVVSIGFNSYGQCNTESFEDIIEIAAGANHTAALRKDGTVVCTGLTDYGRCDTEGWENVG